MTDDRPLVWLPFEPALLDAPPSSLRYEVVVPEEDEDPPASVGEVAFYVPPYRFSEHDSRLAAQMPRLQVVQTLTAGVEHVRQYVPDHAALCNGRGIHQSSTAELALALILASLRGLPDFVRSQDRHVWERPAPRPALADRQVLIVGYGDIGVAIEERLAGFEVEVVRVARRERPGVHAITSLPELLPHADVIVLILPLTDETHGMVDDAFLARMKDGALLVNVARGPVVDTDALVAALGTGRIRAALDVTDPEPLPDGHPLWAAPNVLISPHVGGDSSAMWPRAYQVVSAQLHRFAAGQPLENVMAGEY